MKKYGCLIMLILVGSAVFGQVQGTTVALRSETANAASISTFKEGTFEAVLSRGLDSKKSKVGDLVIARFADDVRLKKGVRVPKNAKLIGHVNEVQAKGKSGAESRLGIVFEKALLSDGKEFPLMLSLQSFTPADALGNLEGESKSIVIEQSSVGNNRSSILRSTQDDVRLESGAHLLFRMVE